MMRLNALASMEANWQGEPLVVFSQRRAATVLDLNIIGLEHGDIADYGPDGVSTFVRLTDGREATDWRLVG